MNLERCVDSCFSKLNKGRIIQPEARNRLGRCGIRWIGGRNFPA